MPGTNFPSGIDQFPPLAANTPENAVPLPGGATGGHHDILNAYAAAITALQLHALTAGAIPGMRGDDGEDAPVIPGPAGVTGSAGATGANGATGSAGATGATGSAGATGATGPTGDTGAGGSAGSLGMRGEDGEDGMTIPGPAGATGPTGATGATGAAGSGGSGSTPGLRGEDGEDGQMIILRAGSDLYYNSYIVTATGAATKIILPVAPYAVDIIKKGSPNLFLLPAGNDYTLSGVNATVVGGITNGTVFLVNLWSQICPGAAPTMDLPPQGFDPSRIGSNMTLSSNNDQCDISGVAGWQSAYVQNLYSSGKRIYELHITYSDAGSMMIGGTLSTSPVSSNLISANAKFWYMQMQGSTNNSADFTLSGGGLAIASGGYIQVAHNYSTKKIWISTGSGWIGSGNPDSDTSPTISYTNATQYVPAIAMYGGFAGPVVFNGSGSFNLNPGNVTTFTPYDN